MNVIKTKICCKYYILIKITYFINKKDDILIKRLYIGKKTTMHSLITRRYFNKKKSRYIDKER